jgi:hypothetical protein
MTSNAENHLMWCPKGQFVATIRNANEVSMNLIGSPTTCIVNRRSIVAKNCSVKHRINWFSAFDVIIKRSIEAPELREEQSEVSLQQP